VPGSAIALTLSSGPAPVTVPDVTGLAQAAAESAIVGAGLTVGATSTANSATVPSGDVIDQSPLGGTLAAPGSAVAITVSLGPAPIPVPDVIGQAQAAAETAITTAGFTVGAVTTAASSTVPAGDVIDQTPLGGTLALPGSAVALTVSSGPAPITVPDVVGQSQTLAEGAIVSAGFTVGAITTVNSDTVPANDVIDQSPLGDTLAAPGSAIALTVSDGPNTVPTLDAIGNQTVPENGSLDLSLSANDDDGHTLSFGHDGLPGFISLTDNGGGSATLSIAPGFDDSGIHTITIRVTDNGLPNLSAEETFDVTVNNVNRAPQINAISNVMMTEGESLTVAISASDPDADGVSFSSPDLPGFAVLNNLAGNNAEIILSPTSSDVGSLIVTIDATDDASSPLVTTTAFSIDVQMLESRVTTGLVAYYPFTTGTGTVVSDQSGNGPPLDLDMSGNVTWLSGSNGVSFSGGRVGTNTSATKVINALVASGASSFEVWALPANAIQTGPARLISVGADNSSQNFVLGQDGPDYQVRLQHTAKDSKARPRLQAVNGVAVAVQHLVHTYDGNTERLFIDGVQQPATVALSGNYNSWDPTDWFNIGNEASSQRPFVGEIYLVAVYDRALSVADVQMNFNAGPNGDSTPPVVPATAFTDITAAAGVTSPAEFGGHGAQFADIDNNGLPDIYVTRNFQPTDMPELLFKNQGAGDFLEEASTRGVANFDTGSHGGVWADFDNDGDYDLFNGSYDQNRLYENNGNGVFTDVTTAAGLPVQSLATRGAIAFDMDRDGDLDIFAVTDFQGTNDPPGPLNEVYRNDGSLAFTPVAAGALEAAPAGQGALAVDFDNDGDLDVIAGNRTGPMNVLTNNGTGIFTLIDPTSIGLSISAGDGITAADVNNDGFLDLMLDQHLFLGTGSGQFSFSRSFEFPTENHFMGGFADLDNDSDYDLVFPGNNYVYLNNGSGSFAPSNVFAIGPVADPRSVSFADIEKDGDLDFYVAQKDVSDLLIRNDSSAIGNWLKISLTRTSGQIGAFGARVTVYEAGGLGDPARRIVWKEATSATGYLAQDDPELHFGLGTETLVDVRVVFLGGAVVDMPGILANVLVSVSE
jgi:beta-lactam-binding protein with PASTA domain